jgi:type VI secretion system protein ImpK
MVALITAVCLGAMFSGFAWVLAEQRASVLQPFQPFESSAQSQQFEEHR